MLILSLKYFLTLTFYLYLHYQNSNTGTPTFYLGFPGGSDSKESCKAGDLGLSLGQEDPLEEGMATHSSILAWRIPWTEEPDGLQSMGSQRVRHE